MSGEPAPISPERELAMRLAAQVVNLVALKTLLAGATQQDLPTGIQHEIRRLMLRVDDATEDLHVTYGDLFEASR